MALDFETVMASCAQEVYAYLTARLGNRFDADDVFQTTFLKVQRNLARFHGDSDPKTWVMRIAINEASTFRSRSRRELTLSCPAEDLPLPGADGPGYDPALDETVADIAAGMQHLDGDLRDVLYFFYYKDMRYEDIASLIGKPVGTVKSRLFRAKEELKGFLEAHHDQTAE
ncbi:MAG TPA: RNA polymerase sigma factor [Candidatus Cryosericum sp.]|nr:RNA polymerase sigma factor [Candidatus Cryosericum sp.]